MVDSPKENEGGKVQTGENANLMDQFKSWLTLPNVIACLIIVGYGGFLIYMLGTVSTLNELIWTRTVYLLAGYEAIAFAAAGYLFGKEVHRQQSENAEKRADKAQTEASNAEENAMEILTKGYRLTEAVKARATLQPKKELKAKGTGIPSSDLGVSQRDLDYLATLADELFPSKPK
jgi:hypothetical protein